MQKIIVALLLICVIWSAHAVELRGALKQGGYAIGRVQPGTHIRLNDRIVKVADDGQFILGFERDAPKLMTLTITHANKSVETKKITIAQRRYDVQRIDGLPPSKVSPSPVDLKRIARENDKQNQVRRIQSTHPYFTQSMIIPVQGRISGVYGSQRILNGEARRPHLGVDIAAPVGTPIKAPASGVVTGVLNDMFFNGNTLIIDHGYGLHTFMMHLHDIRVVEGQKVKQGDVVATVGQSGRATGPHLHWAVGWHNLTLDPSLFVDLSPLPGSKKLNF